MSVVGVHDWGNLSLELWVLVLSCLRTDPYHAWLDRDEMVKDVIQRQADIQQLRLVCKKFKEAVQDSRISSCLVLREPFPDQCIPSLLHWLDLHRTSVQEFAAYCGSPTTDAALAALAVPASQLTSADLSSVSSSAVHILSSHRRLCSIELRTTTQETMNLSALAALPFLKQLFLMLGRFDGIESIAHLTSLHVSQANVESAADFASVSTLCKLIVGSGSFCRLHVQGIAACKNLRELGLSDCEITAGVNGQNLQLMREHPCHLPVQISALSGMTELCVALTDDIGLDWITPLTSLRSLGLQAWNDLVVTSDLNALTGLTKLWLATQDEYAEVSACMDVRLDWQAMRALQSLIIGSGRFEFDRQLLQLVRLTGLTHLSFSRVMPNNVESARYLQALTYQLAAKRPEVLCMLDNGLGRSVDASKD